MPATDAANAQADHGFRRTAIVLSLACIVGALIAYLVAHVDEPNQELEQFWSTPTELRTETQGLKTELFVLEKQCGDMMDIGVEIVAEVHGQLHRFRALGITDSEKLLKLIHGSVKDAALSCHFQLQAGKSVRGNFEQFIRVSRVLSYAYTLPLQKYEQASLARMHDGALGRLGHVHEARVVAAHIKEKAWQVITAYREALQKIRERCTVG